MVLSVSSLYAQDPGATSTLFLTGGTLAGQSVSGSSHTITVAPGASIAGSFTVQINSTFAANAVMAMGVTPSWGTHSTSFTDLGGFSTPVSRLSRTISVNYIAPATSGTYYIIAAYNGEYTAAQVMSATNWSSGNPTWDNGDDIASWSAATVTQADANGNAYVSYVPSARYVPATAIIIDVQPVNTCDPNPGQDSTLILVSGTIAGQAVSPGNRTITVSPGASITGSFNVQINSAFCSNAVMAMGVTPSWGTHSASFTDLGGFSTPVTGLSRTISVNYTAPTTSGTYYIIAAYNGEYTAAQVMSATNWSSGNPTWDNGDDIASWSAATVDQADANGNAYVSYVPSARYVPATAIIINVGSQSPPPSAGLLFVPVTPCRVMDTRNPAGPLGGPFIAGGTTRTVPVSYSSCGVPATASAYSLNVTVVPRAGFLGYLTVWPTGQTQPVVSTLNSFDGSTLANAAIVPAGTSGSINAFASNDTELVMDIDGYFITPGASSNSLQFYPLAPCRVLDTRNPYGTFGGPALTGGTSRSFPIPSSSCGAPGAAAAYSLNVTVVPHGRLGYLSAWPTGQSQPVVSTLNSLDGTILANAAIVPAGTGGAVSFFATDTTDLVVDIDGYFALPGAGGLDFYAVSPCRVVDTRNTSGTLGGPIMNANTMRSFPLTGQCGLPASAAAYSLNLTVDPPGPMGYLSVWPTGEWEPTVSTLNDFKGLAVANAALIPAGTGGSINVYVANTTHVIIDTNGYFQ